MKATVSEPYVRSLLQRVFLTNDDGLEALAILLVRYGFFTIEIVTERERQQRNVCSDLLQMLGLTSSKDMIVEWLRNTKGTAIAAHDADLREAVEAMRDQQELDRMVTQ